MERWVDATTLLDMIRSVTLPLNDEGECEYELFTDGLSAVLTRRSPGRRVHVESFFPDAPLGRVRLSAEAITQIERCLDRVIELSDEDYPLVALAIAPPRLSLRGELGCQAEVEVRRLDLFPPYQQVIHEENQKRAVIDRRAFLAALERVQDMSETRGVRLSLDKGSLKVISDHPVLGEVCAELEVEYTGEALTIGFNPKYFTDFLAQVDSDRIGLELDGGLDPIIVRPVADPVLRLEVERS